MHVGSSVARSATFRTVIQAGWMPILCFLLLTSLPVHANDYRTPLAGESFHTELFGESVDVATRDRRRVTSVNMGIQWIPQGPTQLQLLPFAALYLRRNWDDGHRRFRGVFSGVFNDVNFNLGTRSLNGGELVFALDNTMIRLDRSEYVEGQRIQDVEVAWSHIFGGIGIGYHHLLPPWHQDSAL
jgi:hypothetical protein